MKEGALHSTLKILASGGLLALFAILGISAANRPPLRRSGNGVKTPESVETSRKSVTPHTSHDASAYDSLPLSFEPNVGQTDGSVQYVSHEPGYTLFLTPKEAVLSFQQPDQDDNAIERMDRRTRRKFESRKFYRLSARFHHPRKATNIRVTLEGANPSSKIAAFNQLPGKANYFIGRNQKNWRTGVPTYGKVRYASIYPGTDLLFYGRQGRLEFDFVLKPGANPNAIRLRFDAPEAVSITKGGTIRVSTERGPFDLLRPVIYQMRDGKEVPVNGGFKLLDDKKTVGVEVAEYDRAVPLIIDPVLSYSTYVGGNGTDYTSGVAVDSQGDSYIAGQTTSTNFPTTSNGYASSGNANGVAFVTELNPAGTAVLYSTYLGGSGGDWCAGMTLDPNGNVYLAGSTLSTDFPLMNPVQTSLLSPNGNAFVARIDTTQTGTSSLIYSTYLGGGGNTSNSLGDLALGVAADSSGLAYVTGQTASDASVAPFPTTSNALQSSLASVNGNAFLTVLDTTNGGPLSLVYSTYLGGASVNFGDYGEGISVDSSGNAYLTGQTTSGGSGPFPITSGAYQSALNSQNGNAFVMEFATGASSCQCLIYSSYFGGSSPSIVGDWGTGVAVDSSGKIHVAGSTSSSDFPVTSGAFQTTNSAGGRAFAAEFDPTQTGAQSLVYSTFLGGSNGPDGEDGNGIALDASGDTFVAGNTSSTDFPTTSGAPQPAPLSQNSWHAFFSELNPSGSNLLFSTYYGGSCTANDTVLGDYGSGVAVDWVGNIYMSGSTCSIDLPVYPSSAYQTALAGTYNGFVAKIAFNANPGITASVSPSPNSSSWNNSPVTVSFSCIPGAAAIQTCPSAVTVNTEGADQVISGSVVDTSNNSATASDTVNLDMTPPVISITSPSSGANVSSTTLTVTGTITDVLSGVSTAACNGQQATISGSNFSCSLSISSATDTITVTGADVAGNAATASVTVNLAIPGGFAPTSNLNIARQGQTATLLANGMVLIAGGSDANGNEQATAELYNPATGTFTATGSMTVPRINHTATLLNDGTVLIAGGYDSNFNSQNSAEIYSPATGTFAAVGNMSTGRASHTATLLQDGTVLIAGGYDSNFNALASAELYNPSSGTFAGVGDLVTGRVLHTATLLNNGQVLIAGGQDTNYDTLASAELYNPTSQTFAATGNLNTGRYYHTATLLNNGMVLFAGGEGPNYTLQASAELFDPNTGTFGVTGSLLTARSGHTATLLGNGTVLVAGGADGSGTLASTELYDPVAQTFSASANLNDSRSDHTATLLNSATVLLVGGFQSSGGVDPILASAEVYQPTSLAPANLASIVVSPSVASIPAGTAQQFTATGTFTDNSTEVLSSVIWSSSDNTVAALTNDWTNHGSAIAVASGSATVNACTGTICGSTTLTVTAAQLSITGLSPAAGDIGAQVIVSGTGFGATQGSSTVTFNGTSASVLMWSATGIVVTVPAAATSGSVVVNVGGTNSNGVPFTVTSGPVITALSPTSGFAGTAVSISGTNFGAAQGTSTVTFNGLAATVTSWSTNSISVTVPNGATSGNVVVIVSGVTSNAVAFTVPGITLIAPNSGPVGTLATIEGSGFGAAQGSGVVSINGTPMQVVSWSDGVILAAVANGTTSGTVMVQQGSLSLPGPTFTIGGTFPYNVSPQNISLLVGQSRTLSAPTGLHWISSNANVVSLSTDDPPVLTGVNAGSATIYAGVVPISVNVYSGSLPAGTTIWSLPITGIGVGTPIVPAVPSASGVDVFVLANNVLSAITPDGNITWQTPTNAESVIPDFSGNAYLYHPVTAPNSNYVADHTVGKVDPVTHQETTIYTFDTEQDPENTINGGPVNTDRLGTEAVIPDTLGNLFIEDIDKVVVFNSSGQQVASIPLESSTIECPPIATGTNGLDSTNPVCPYLTSVTLSPVEGKMIVAGDGNAYVPYLYTNSSGTKLMLLRVSPDGSYAKIVLNTYDSDMVGWLAEAAYRQAASPSPLSVITNADQGVAVFSPAAYQNGNLVNPQVTYVSGDAVTAQVSLTLNSPPWLAQCSPSCGYQYDGGGVVAFWPQLQRADGTYIGTVGLVYAGGECLTDDNPCPSAATVQEQANENSAALAAVGPGGIVWQEEYPSSDNPAAILPLYATSDGGTVVTSSQKVLPDLNYGQFSLGTLYTLDQNGNITSQTADTGAVPSWTNQWYVDPSDSISSIFDAPILFDSAWAAIIGGNHSGTGASVQQQWYPPLPSCGDPKLNLTCPGAQEALNDAFNSLKNLVKGNCPACSTYVFSKLGGSTQEQFYQYLSPGALLFDGTRSTLRMDWFECGNPYVHYLTCDYSKETVADYMANTASTAISQVPSRYGKMLTFFVPSSVCNVWAATPGGTLNEAAIFHEALHGFTGWLDRSLIGPSLMGAFDIDFGEPSEDISFYLEDNVLGGGPHTCGN